MAKKKVDLTQSPIERVEIDNGPMFDPIISYHIVGPSTKSDRLLLRLIERDTYDYDWWATNLNIVFDRIESEIQKILEPYPHPASKGGYFIPSDAPRDVHDAREAYETLRFLRECWKEDSVEWAIKAALKLGMALTRAEVRPFEDDVERGQSYKRNQKKATTTRCGPNDEIAERRKDIFHAVEKLRAIYRSRGEKDSANRAFIELEKNKASENAKGMVMTKGAISKQYYEYKKNTSIADGILLSSMEEQSS